jgi:hypothetical protein
MVKMGDKMADLPVDTIPPTTEEKEMCGWLFGNPTENLKKSVSSLWNEFQNYLYLGLLFAVLSLSPVDSLLRSILPLASSFILLLVIKTFIFLLLYWLFLNSRFSR